MQKCFSKNISSQKDQSSTTLTNQIALAQSKTPQQDTSSLQPRPHANAPCRQTHIIRAAATNYKRRSEKSQIYGFKKRFIPTIGTRRLHHILGLRHPIFETTNSKRITKTQRSRMPPTTEKGTSSSSRRQSFSHHKLETTCLLRSKHLAPTKLRILNSVILTPLQQTKRTIRSLRTRSNRT